jgi:multiple sugar transport system permease protein
VFPRLPRGGEGRLAYLLNLPALIAVFAVIGYPILDTLWLSLHRYRLAPPSFRFVGLDNYVSALTSDPALIDALKFSVLFSALSVPLILIVGLAAALVLNESFPGRGLVRALVVVPWAVPSVVNGQLWQMIFNSKYGALNGLLYSLGFIDEYKSWLTDAAEAIPALLLAHVWNSVPVAIIVFLAALQAIPGELYEAARVDRAGPLQRLRHIVIPWLQQAILIVLVLQTIVALRTYDIIYVLTGGGPGTSTTTISWLAAATAFRFLDFGLGSTYSFVMAVVTLCLAIVYFKLLYARGDFRV